MDCFYAAIEVRDNPSLANKPVAVGGQPDERSVLCTCNYVARKYGVRSAMSSAYAKKLCPELIILPVNMPKYKLASQIIQEIFHDYTALVEPLSLDEAYLDVTASSHCQGSATWIAQEIKEKIYKATQLTASAGVAPNKFLAKIASGWNKPNGLYVIKPNEVERFVINLPVSELFGVGKVTANKLEKFGIKICSDIQKFSLPELSQRFGKLGLQLYEQSKGIDNRPVNPNRVRKSLSVERTFLQDLKITDNFTPVINELYAMLIKRLQDEVERPIKSIFVKIKSSDFKVSNLERSCTQPTFGEFQRLLQEFIYRESCDIRLLGLGVNFTHQDRLNDSPQHSLL